MLCQFCIEDSDSDTEDSVFYSDLDAEDSVLDSDSDTKVSVSVLDSEWEDSTTSLAQRPPPFTTRQMPLWHKVTNAAALLSGIFFLCTVNFTSAHDTPHIRLFNNYFLLYYFHRRCLAIAVNVRKSAVVSLIS